MSIAADTAIIGPTPTQRQKNNCKKMGRLITPHFPTVQLISADALRPLRLSVLADGIGDDFVEHPHAHRRQHEFRQYGSDDG